MKDDTPPRALRGPRSSRPEENPVHRAAPVPPADPQGAPQASRLPEDPLAVLCVIPRLRVGPVRVERRSVTAAYQVTVKGKTLETDLAYRYEEDVFDPNDPASLNLAGMIAAQAALNYGLFCQEIVLDGRFDIHDRKFINDMAANTAREILVKKFLEPNPFLRGPASRLPVTRRDNYLRARIVFPESVSPAPRRDRAAAEVYRESRTGAERYAVLSSGGKDSLLSLALLREMDLEVHPIFINESGRHWFTALNAYRYFTANVPRTARVWTNADRVFAWMLRHLPFVRPDFARLRSDEYPIRLWTVPVFLFGALPLMRKRDIGRLIIGDEHDTTQKVSYQGIRNYDGLYDQSRYFDDAATRYFHRKRWDTSQFSILRTLSELVVEKILVERYPDLQRQQISCHAAHAESGRVLPCGKCEKCRRIVGMLLALDADPALCGYSEEDKVRCLRDLGEKGIHQEREAVEHLAFLLHERGLLPRRALGHVRPRARPEVMKLRFHRERSPVEAIPVGLREPLYRIYLEYAEGAVRRSGRVWIDFDPLTDPALRRPYPFETLRSAGDEKKPGKDAARSRPGYLVGELTWPEAQARFREVDVALLPVGSVEQHGPHLPLDTDSFDADYLARGVAAACSDPKPLVLPLIPFGVSYHHEDFSGTIGVSPESLSRMVYDIGMSAARHGITKLVIINGHGGNSPALHYAAQMINRDAHIFTCVDTGETSDADIAAIADTPNDVHAGEIETSTALAVRPHLVRLDQVKAFVPEFSSRYLNFSSKRSVGWYGRIAKMSPEGVLGDPTKASSQKGRRMWELMIAHLVELVEDLKRMSLDEIHQRRY